MSRLPKVGVNFHNAVSWITKGAGTQVKHANGRGAVTDPPGLAPTLTAIEEANLIHYCLHVHLHVIPTEFSLLRRDASQSLCFCNCAADYSEVHSCDSVECEIGGVNLAIVFR